MAEQKRVNRFFGWVGKFSLIVALIWGLIQIFSFFSASDYSITVDGEHSFWELPESFKRELVDLKYSVIYDSLETLLPIIGDEKKRKKTARSLYEYFHSQIDSAFDYDFRYVRSIWSFKLRNEGKKEIKDLRLELPFDGFYNLKGSGEGPISSKFSKNIKVGDLRPSNEYYVTVWSEQTSESFYENDTRVTYENGIITIRYPAKVTGLLAWFARNKEFLLLFPFVVALVLGVFFGGAVLGWIIRKFTDDRSV